VLARNLQIFASFRTTFTLISVAGSLRCRRRVADRRREFSSPPMSSRAFSIEVESLNVRGARRRSPRGYRQCVVLI